MTEQYVKYLDGLVAKLSQLDSDREAVRKHGFAGYLADALADGYPDTPQTRTWARWKIATDITDLDYKIAQHRLSIELAGVSIRHYEAIRNTVQAWREAKAAQTEAATQLTRQGDQP